MFVTTVTVKVTEKTARNYRKWIYEAKPVKQSPSTDTKDTKKTASETMMSIFVNTCTSEADSIAFWIDNGSTQNITNCSEYMLNLTKFLSPCKIKASGKTRKAAIGKETF